jgi:hypothetical protein
MIELFGQPHCAYGHEPDPPVIFALKVALSNSNDLCVLWAPVCCTAAAGVLAATGILTGVYYATPKETKDKIRRRVKKTTEE